ncbi:CIC11C00000001124 [Sungouiella intermedia]|uniref:CIC11C00000001124 n=1 Tax=Sungouiella intermedia TaxID=45354 RepID=A0A1L0BGM5_9ASCO|nr:CIC11C00000001124 [[Candida] intermedia]
MLSRLPGFFERYFICRSTGGHLSNGFHMSVCLNKTVDDVILSNALRALLLKHPIHCLQFFRQDSLAGSLAESSLLEDKKANCKNYDARFVSQILYNDVVVHQEVESLDSTFFRNLHDNRIPINVERPNWILVVNQIKGSDKQYLTLSSNHVFIDGNSGVNFMDDLVKELAEVETIDDRLFVTVLFNSTKDAPAVLPKANEDVVGLFNLTPWFIFKTIVRMALIPSSVAKFFKSYFVPGHPNLYKHPIFDFYPVSHDNKSNFNRVTLTREASAKSLRYCRLSGVTMTPFIAACAMKALDSTFAQVLADSPSYTFNIDVCGRRYYPELKKEMRYGLFASTVGAVISGDSTILQAAKKISTKLVDNLKSRACFPFAGLLRLVNFWDFFQKKYDNKAARTSIEVSNVGLLKINHADWNVDDFIFSQGVGMDLLTISASSTSLGGMNLVVANHESLDEVDKGHAMEQFIEKFQQYLENGESIY